MDCSKIDLSHQKTLSFNCVEFLIEKYKVKKEKAKTRLENNVKHEMDWVEKMNTRFEKQKMGLENEKRK
mgnify:CR=1 FL=1